MDNPSQGTPEIGSQRGDYEILELLGTGGMGQVFKVRNVYSGRIEAMKVLLPNLADQKDLAERFIREIRMLADLHHPNIAELRTAVTINNQLVMIMEYVEGATLAARVHQGAIPYGQALGYIEQVLSALSYAHERHIIHRDIKPSNMMLTPEGVVKLMDFGIAQRVDQGDLTRTNTTVGSFAYMSPEQIKGEAVDGRSDLYSVGISLYEMVTGQRPFPADTAFSALQAHLQTPPRPPIEIRPDLPETINKLILMAVSKDPAARFQTADAFAAAVHSISPIGAETVAAVPVPVAPAARAAAASGGTAASMASPTKAAAAVLPTPAAQTVPMPSPTAQKTHRGLYITVGALIVFAVVAAAAVVPRHVKTAALKKRTATSAQTQSVPAQAAVSPTSAAPATSVPASSATVRAPAASSSGTATSSATSAPQTTSSGEHAATVTSQPPAAPTAHAHAARAKTKAAQATALSQDQPGAATVAPTTPPEPDPAQLQALDLENDQLSGRAAAVNSSLDALQKEQAAQGLGLRGDIVASQQRMQSYMAKAQAAIQAQDTATARKYLDLAAAEVEKIEKFLGR